jgi:hypothetical protein
MDCLLTGCAECELVYWHRAGLRCIADCRDLRIGLHEEEDEEASGPAAEDGWVWAAQTVNAQGHPPRMTHTHNNKPPHLHPSFAFRLISTAEVPRALSYPHQPRPAIPLTAGPKPVSSVMRTHDVFLPTSSIPFTS